MTVVAENLNRIQDRITAACLAAGRRVGSVSLVAVSKRVDPERVLDACGAGQWILGENRVPDALARIESFPALLRDHGLDPALLKWHFIGTLQQNKVRKVVGAFELIHGVDSLALARRIDRAAGEAGLRQAVLLQVNASQETQKHGLALDEAPEAAAQALQLLHLDIQGFMTMGRVGAGESELREIYGSLRRLSESVRASSGAPLPHLSMGMSDDFEVGIAEGATMVRIGTTLFGSREQ